MLLYVHNYRYCKDTSVKRLKLRCVCTEAVSMAYFNILWTKEGIFLNLADRRRWKIFSRSSPEYTSGQNLGSIMSFPVIISRMQKNAGKRNHKHYGLCIEAFRKRPGSARLGGKRRYATGIDPADLHPDFSYAVTALEHGALAYLLKPFKPEELHSTIRQAIAKSGNFSILPDSRKEKLSPMPAGRLCRNSSGFSWSPECS